jgi:hypothetical protein
MTAPQAASVTGRQSGRSLREEMSNHAASLSMRGLYLTRLAITFQAIDEEALPTAVQRNTFALVRSRLEAFVEAASTPSVSGWNAIYELERLIALLLSGAALRQEVAGRIRDLSVEDASAAIRFEGEFMALCKPAGAAAKGPDDEALRSFLLRVLEVLQWRANERHLTQPIRKRAEKNILGCLLVAFGLLVFPYVYLNVDFSSAETNTGGSGSTQAVAHATPRSVTDAAPLGVPATRAVSHSEASESARRAGQVANKWWSLFTLWTALTAGLLGAFFSRLLSVQRAGMSLDEAFMHRELSYSLLRAGVGVCGALIAYFFLRSGIVEGALFPNFKEVAIEWVQAPKDTLPISIVVPSKALALLTFWCFLAGFSEALVPRILSNAERQLTDAATAPMPR